MSPFDDLMTGAKLIAAIADPDELGEITAQLRQIVERLEARLDAIPDEPIQRAVAEPVEEAPEPRKPRSYVTGSMSRAEVEAMFNASRRGGGRFPITNKGRWKPRAPERTYFPAVSNQGLTP